jgi:hypothetical protein
LCVDYRVVASLSAHGWTVRGFDLVDGADVRDERFVRDAAGLGVTTMSTCLCFMG